MISQDITFGVASQSLVYDVPEGRPDGAPTVTVYAFGSGDNSTAESALGSASLEDPANVTLSAAAGASQTDPRALSVSDTSDLVVGRFYELIGDAVVEQVQIKSIADSTSATLVNPLANDFASSDVLRSYRALVAVDDTWAADSTNLKVGSDSRHSWRARWSYDVGGVSYVKDTYFSLVRYAGGHEVTPQDIENDVSGWLASLPRDERHNQGRDIIARAYERVDFDFTGLDIDDAAVRSPDLIRELVIARTKVQWLEGRMYLGLADPLVVADARSQYELLMQQHVSVVGRAPIDQGDGAASVPQAQGITSR